jgi:hypothetical protein
MMDNKEMLDQAKQDAELHNAECKVATAGGRITPTPLAEQVEDRLSEAVERARQLCDLAKRIRYQLVGFSIPEDGTPTPGEDLDGLLPRSLNRAHLLIEIHRETEQVLAEVLEQLPR